MIEDVKQKHQIVWNTKYVLSLNFSKVNSKRTWNNGIRWLNCLLRIKAAKEIFLNFDENKFFIFLNNFKAFTPFSLTEFSSFHDIGNSLPRMLTLLQNGSIDVPGAVLEFEEAPAVIEVIVRIIRGVRIDDEQHRAHHKHCHSNQNPSLANKQKQMS